MEMEEFHPTGRKTTYPFLLGYRNRLQEKGLFRIGNVPVICVTPAFNENRQICMCRDHKVY